MTTTKRSFDFEAIRGAIAQPHVLGPLLGAMPELTRGLVGGTGGVGLFGVMDMLRNRGRNFGAFFKGPIGGRSPVGPAGPVGHVGGPTPAPQAAPAAAIPPAPTPFAAPALDYRGR